MKLVVLRDIENDIASRPNGQSASKRLADLKKAFQNQAAVSPVWFKASGSGRSATFPPYAQLGLWHAKLDPGNSNGGDPILVFQEMRDPETGQLEGYMSIALTDHKSYATSDHQKCREWLWENRVAITWEGSTQAILDDLEQEFAPQSSWTRT